MIELLNMDCMTYMSTLPDKAFSLGITDPPYGIGQPKQSNLKGYNGRESLETRLSKNRLNSGGGKLKDRTLNTSNCEWDNAIPDQEYFDELMRVCENVIIWGGNYFPLPPSRCILCWDKVQPWENFSQIELAWTSFDSPAQLFKFDNRTGDKIHPTQKPVQLYEWVLNKYAKTGHRILDTHLGSGSSAIAAHNLGFDFVGMELDKYYFDAACARLKSHQAQQTLFSPNPLADRYEQVDMLEGNSN
jgi:site-specific DNA-methyltransferase (adenine-specific)